MATRHEKPNAGNVLRLLGESGTAGRYDRLDLRRADLSGANLSNQDLSWLDLTGVQFRWANLSGAKFTKSDLGSANLSNVSVDGADFTDSVFGATILGDVDLSAAKGLDRARHYCPSFVSIDTLCRSRGVIPEAFLRGCGVPEHVIGFQKSLVASVTPIQFYSCFVSYSGSDEEFAKRLHGRLQQEGLRVWFAPEDMKAGRKLHEQIDDAIRVHDKLLLVLSDASMKSEWVATEISKARKREHKEGKQVLFPVRLADFETIKEWECFDADAGKDSAREIREFYIPDFSNWKDHDLFETEFGKLLRALRASAL